MIGRKVHGIIKGGLAAGVDVIERIDQIAYASREILLEVGRVVEVHDERLIIRIALADKRQRGAIHAFAFIPHAAAVVDDEADAQRDVFVLERLDCLLDLVFEDLKMVFRESVYGPALLVEHRNRQLHFECFDAQCVALVLVRFLGL